MLLSICIMIITNRIANWHLLKKTNWFTIQLRFVEDNAAVKSAPSVLSMTHCRTSCSNVSWRTHQNYQLSLIEKEKKSKLRKKKKQTKLDSFISFFYWRTRVLSITCRTSCSTVSWNQHSGLLCSSYRLPRKDSLCRHRCRSLLDQLSWSVFMGNRWKTPDKSPPVKS